MIDLTESQIEQFKKEVEWAKEEWTKKIAKIELAKEVEMEVKKIESTREVLRESLKYSLRLLGEPTSVIDKVRKELKELVEKDEYEKFWETWQKSNDGVWGKKTLKKNKMLDDELFEI